MSSIPGGGIGVRGKSEPRHKWEGDAKHMYPGISVWIGTVEKNVCLTDSIGNKGLDQKASAFLRYLT